MSAEKPRIIFKRVVKRGGGHAGGTWKIAFADFMTAMMALFLVLWLLATVTPKQREGIAEHFRKPLDVVLSGGAKSSTSGQEILGGGARNRPLSMGRSSVPKARSSVPKATRKPTAWSP